MTHRQTTSYGEYDFAVYEEEEVPDALPASAGIYVFAALERDEWAVLYVGRSIDVRSRLANHERWQEAQAEGMTHVLVHEVLSKQKRDRAEEELIQAFQPTLNR